MLGRVVFAHVVKHACGLHIQLFNQFFVILQSTKSIFGVMLWNKKILTTDNHLWTDLVYERRLVNRTPVTQRECQYNACQCGSKLHSPFVPHLSPMDTKRKHIGHTDKLHIPGIAKKSMTNQLWV